MKTFYHKHSRTLIMMGSTKVNENHQLDSNKEAKTEGPILKKQVTCCAFRDSFLYVIYEYRIVAYRIVPKTSE